MSDEITRALRSRPTRWRVPQHRLRSWTALSLSRSLSPAKRLRSVLSVHAASKSTTSSSVSFCVQAIVLASPLSLAGSRPRADIYTSGTRAPQRRSVPAGCARQQRLIQRRCGCLWKPRHPNRHRMQRAPFLDGKASLVSVDPRHLSRKTASVTPLSHRHCVPQRSCCVEAQSRTQLCSRCFIGWTPQHVSINVPIGAHSRATVQHRTSLAYRSVRTSTPYVSLARAAPGLFRLYSRNWVERARHRTLVRSAELVVRSSDPVWVRETSLWAELEPLVHRVSYAAVSR